MARAVSIGEPTAITGGPEIPAAITGATAAGTEADPAGSCTTVCIFGVPVVF